MTTSNASFAAGAERASREPPSSTSGARQSDARSSVARVLLAPFALLLAALAGILYAVLLPICGVASIAEATARTSWGIVRDAFRRTRHRAASRA